MSKLADYKARRDFTKTAEPRGTKRVASAKYPRFVIQEHDATRLHYDLRLEFDGVFKSWAVTKGPSLNPHDKRLAVEVEDHPLAYGDFEGTIPDGEYGGGTVLLWDRGFWLPEETTDVAEALRRGELKFMLAGEKLKGRFVLVRMKDDAGHAKRHNWLLIKHRDDYARETGDITKNSISVASGRSLTEIAAGKKPGPKPFMALKGKPGAADAIWHSKPAAKAATASKQQVRKPMTTDTLPSFIAPQLCKSVTRPPSGDDWVHEVKFDGYRVQLRVSAGDVQLRTRTGLDWTDKFQSLAAAAATLPDCIIDGEVVALDETGAPDFAALQAALSENQTDNLVYFAFDLLFEAGEDLRALPLSARKQRLEALLHKAEDSNRIRFVQHLAGAGDAVLQSACRMHLEGVVSKSLSAPYRSGRADTWMKSKCRAGHEVVIGGWSGTKSNLRSLIAGVYRGDHLVYVGQVGTGFNARNTPGLLTKLTANATSNSPFAGDGAPQKQKDWNWVKPVLVAEIEFSGWTGAGMIRQSSFKGLRQDKPATDVRVQRPAAPTKAQMKSARLKAPRGTKIQPSANSNIVMGVTISHADKVLWPATKSTAAATKRDLADYLEQIGHWMLDHVKGRPCSVIRAPDGIGAQQFFQRHAMPGLSNLVTLVTVSGDRKPYLQIDRVEALIALAQIAGLEFHPWNSAPSDPDTPGRLVFDLDPAPDVAFAAVIDAANELRGRIEHLGLIPFCKTTGGKGLHVVVPLKSTAGAAVQWPDAKRFAEAVCATMANDSPDSYLVNMSKKQRTGRIFLDYLRNDRMSTAVAPLSPRARPGAPVSMPLDWDDVRKSLDVTRFNLETAPDLLRKNKPWSDYARAERPLKAAIKKLVSQS